MAAVPQMTDPAPQQDAGATWHGLIARLGLLVSAPGSSSSSASSLDDAARKLEEWSKKFTQDDSISFDDLPKLCIFLRFECFNFTVSQTSPGSQVSSATDELKGRTVLEVASFLLDQLIIDGDGDAYKQGETLLALLSGLQLHLDRNKTVPSKRDANLSIHRTFFASVFGPTLARIVLSAASSAVHAPSGKFTVGEMCELPNKAQRLALEIIDELLVGSSKNKTLIRTLLNSNRLGELIDISTDEHTLGLTLGLAVHLTPPAKQRESATALEDRQDWIVTLVTEQRFGPAAVDLREHWATRKASDVIEEVQLFAEALAKKQDNVSPAFSAPSVVHNTAEAALHPVSHAKPVSPKQTLARKLPSPHPTRPLALDDLADPHQTARAVVSHRPAAADKALKKSLEASESRRAEEDKDVQLMGMADGSWSTGSSRSSSRSSSRVEDAWSRPQLHDDEHEQGALAGQQEGWDEADYELFNLIVDCMKMPLQKSLDRRRLLHQQLQQIEDAHTMQLRSDLDELHELSVATNAPHLQRLDAIYEATALTSPLCMELDAISKDTDKLWRQVQEVLGERE